MKRILTYLCINFFISVSVFGMLQTEGLAAEAVSSRGVSEPPFLSYGTKANLLLLLDNSGSMLDLAYVDETGADQCYDDSYDNANAYGGYFDETSWYFYDFVDDATSGLRFVRESTEPSFCGSASYTASDAGGARYVCVTTGSDTVTEFAATGKFLNWAAATKFDIQKKILTGGKYDSTSQALQLETRGCSGSRFVKQINLDQTDNQGDPYKLPLAVRGPREVYDLWYAKGDYLLGDIISDNNMLYQANNNITGNPTNDSPEIDTTNWTEYWGTRWKAGQSYVANTAIYSMETEEWYWTQRGGIAANVTDITQDDLYDYDDTDHSDDTGLDWKPYYGTSIEIFAIVPGGFDDTACQEAIDMLSVDLVGDDTDEYNLGEIKTATEECMGFEPGGDTLDRARKSSFNHAMQECWYYNKFDRWQPGGGTVGSLKNSCENVYLSIDPWNITPYDSSYVCSGSYINENDKSKAGYIGRCWEVQVSGVGCVDTDCPTGTDLDALDPDGDNFWEEGVEQYTCSNVTGTNLMYSCATNNCNKNGLVGDKPGDWSISQTCEGSVVLPDLDQEWTNDDFYYFDPCPYQTCMVNDEVTAACPDAANTACDDWTCVDNAGTEECSTADVSANGDSCVDQAIKDFCNIYSVAEVIDPSDATTSTDEIWNMPAFLIDGGIEGQLNQPIATMRGYVYQPDLYQTDSGTPEGVLHSTENDLRIGAMAFNAVGSSTECAVDTDSSLAIDKYCPDEPTENEDGARVITKIELGSLETIAGRTHVDDLVDSINDVPATSWTPLAEAMYNAIGYYTQNDAMRLNTTDFTTGGVGDDPVTDWCQENHILIITEGASTADISTQVTDYLDGTTASLNGATMLDDSDLAPADNDASTGGTCTDGLLGSTYLDDLTYYAQYASADELYPIGNRQLPSDDGDKDKKNITTHIVVTGDLRGSITDTDECSPARIMSDAATQGGSELIISGNSQELEDNLLAVFNELRERASAGSAASVISSSRGGEGAIYQAIFWPEQAKTNVFGDEYNVSWVGDVHALFIDENGYLYEDTDDDRIMTPWDVDNDDNDNGICDNTEADCRIIVYYDSDAKKTRACKNTSIFTGECTDWVELNEVKFLWSANDQLTAIDDLEIGTNRIYSDTNNKRYIFTWNDLNNDGAVVDGEVLPFEPGQDWAGMANPALRGPVTHDFDVSDNGEVDEIVRWVRGEDQTGMRSRQFDFGITAGVVDIGTWRLGDIIHSTPMIVAAPAEAFNLLYHDLSYAVFSGQYKTRRQMVYFGGNDGMLHAVNGGFYDEKNKKFTLGFTVGATPDLNSYTDIGPELGVERWAYVPYNLLPHLKSLTRPEYVDKHKYFVDLRPRIFDAQIFPDDATHPYGWGTILVGGMRFGGAPVLATELPLPEDATVTKNLATDKRVFTSAYFVLDITDPEVPPTLLGEVTRKTDAGADMGYSTVISTMVIMKDVVDTDLYAHNTSDWYLILGSGPHGVDAIKGVSDQGGKVAVIPLKTDGGSTANIQSDRKMWIPDSLPTNIGGGYYPLEYNSLPDNDSFVSDLITIDFDINPSTIDYMADAVYFGTVDGAFGTNANGTFWDGGGKLYRLVTRGDGNYGKGVTQQVTTPDQWYLSPLIDAQRPITGAPNVGYDDQDNFWVYFGTGRFFHADDKTDTTQQRFYGIKEPLQWGGTGIRKFTWPTVVENAIGTDPGEKGLLNVSEILVDGSPNTIRDLYCMDSADTTVTAADGTPLPQVAVADLCLPFDKDGAPINEFSGLEGYISGKNTLTELDECANLSQDCKDGWYKDFWPYENRERNLGQSTLLGGLLLFTTYQPYSDVCEAEGLAYLYGLYYKTGTAWTESVFGDYDGGDYNNINKDKFSLGEGLATTPNLHTGNGGDGKPKAFVQTSTGEIKEIKQEVSPLSGYDTGRSKWKVYQRCP